MLQHAVHLLNARRAFADGGSDALDAAAAHVADRKYPGNIGLEELRRARIDPFGCGQILAAQIRAGADESFVVERDAGIQPSSCTGSAPVMRNT